MEETTDTLKWIREALKNPDEFDLMRKLEETGCVEMRKDSRGRWKWKMTEQGRKLARILQEEENNVHERKLQDQEGDEGSLQERRDD